MSVNIDMKDLIKNKTSKDIVHERRHLIIVYLAMKDLIKFIYSEKATKFCKIFP